MYSWYRGKILFHNHPFPETHSWLQTSFLIRTLEPAFQCSLRLPCPLLVTYTALWASFLKVDCSHHSPSENPSTAPPASSSELSSCTHRSAPHFSLPLPQATTNQPSVSGAIILDISYKGNPSIPYRLRVGLLLHRCSERLEVRGYFCLAAGESGSWGQPREEGTQAGHERPHPGSWWIWPLKKAGSSSSSHDRGTSHQSRCPSIGTVSRTEGRTLLLAAPPSLRSFSFQVS